MDDTKKPIYRRAADEPLMDAQGINLQWGKTWPRVIARAWYIEEQKKQYPGVPPQGADWYEKLLSGKPEQVRDALEEEGFAPRYKVYGRGSGNTRISDNNFDWFWKLTNIVIKKAEDGAMITKNEADPHPISIIPFDDQNVPKYEHKQPDMERERRGDDYVTLVTQVNGWSETSNINQHSAKERRLAHTLILTLPPRPDKPEFNALAITDYEAKGLIYPFTICC
jgi:hypothetical protein